MRVRVVIAAALALAACHRQARRSGEEWVKSVGIEGNKAMSDRELEEGLALHRAEEDEKPLDPYLVDVDADRLRGKYLREGYFEVDVQSRVEREGDAATVTYTVQEGRRARTRVVISGLPDDIDPDDVRRVLPLKEGAPFDYEKYDAAKLPLLSVVKNAGYAHATLDAKVHAEVATRTARVELAYTPGPRCTFGEVDIQGADGDLREAIERRLRFAPGDRYSQRAISQTQRAIYGIGRFSTVQVEPAPGSDGSPVVGVKIAVVPSAPRQITLGGGFGIDPVSYEVRGRAGYEITGWPRPLEKVTTELRPAYAYLRDGSGLVPRVRALARLERLDLFSTRAVGTVEAGYEYLAYEAFTEYGPRAKLGYAFDLGRRWKVRTGWLFQRFAFREISPLIDDQLRMEIGLDHPERVGALAQMVIADYRDHPVTTRSGWYGEVQVVEGFSAVGSAYTFQQVVPELRGYVPLGDVTLAARARFGAILGEAPPTERFYAGGATSNRGFPVRRLSPSVTGVIDGDMLTVPYGGTAMIDTSIEVRIPLTTVRKMPVGGVLFLDGGDVTEGVSDLSLANLHWALGAGVRVKTLVGPVRADVGYRLNRKGATDPEPGSSFAFHLSLGEAF